MFTQHRLCRKVSTALTIIMSALLGSTVVKAQSAALVPFDEFYRQASSAQPSDYVNKPGLALTDTGAFQAMQHHIATLYAGVHVQHSYLVESHPYDCVPITQQPSVRLQNLQTIASPPPFDISGGAESGRATSVNTQLDPARTVDALGNKIGCEAGTIPMRRVALEDLGRFKSLGDFFQKGPDGASQFPDPTRSAVPAVAASHKYAHSYQYVNNSGGTSDMSLWNPVVKTNLNEVFSLSQFWFANTSSPVQTLEAGLQNYPQKYNTTSTVLFIYWTSDGYKNVGCYNLDCSGFVQTNSNIHLGAGFSSYSTDGGAQYFVNLRAFLYQGNWWLYLGGGAASNAFGYYPGSVYHGRPMTKGATEIDFGGEVVGTTIWPPMGSGKFASTGFGHAAYHKNISYYTSSPYSSNANLQVEQPSPSCFTDVTHDNSGIANWMTYFYFGGPGGAGC